MALTEEPEGAAAGGLSANGPTRKRGTPTLNVNYLSYTTFITKKIYIFQVGEQR